MSRIDFAQFHRPSKPTNIPERPKTSSDFLAADKSHIQYLSFDNKELKVGQEAYQITTVDNSYKLILKKVKIVDLISDGRIRIVSNIRINNVDYNTDTLVDSNQVCVNAQILVQDWLIKIRQKKNIEIPAIEQSLIDIWKENWPNDDYDIVVGEGDIEI